MLKFLDYMSRRFAGATLTQKRISAAIAIAAVADFLQIALVPLEWLFVQQIIDVVAMALTMAVLGFHLLLLPTFLIEFVPGVDMLPTWTGCVIAVIALRKREQSPPKDPPVIET
jgi:hypothetical protein